MINNNPYIPYVSTFKASKEFSYLAEFFNKHKMYCNIPKETPEYREFWEDVKDKCINGMTNSVGISITGPHFFYLNFCPILGYNEVTGRKSKIFPKFVDLDYEKFWMAQFCRDNQKSLTAVKGRRQGWSYYAAALCSHEYSFYPDSRSIIGAFMGSFSQNTMNMVVDNLNHLNTNTEFRKQRNPDTKDYVLSRYQMDIGGVKVWKGYHSAVKAISYKDNPTAAVGLTANWLILDEAGVFPNITATWGYSEPLIKDGSIYTGVGLIFGSSGDMESGSKYFYEMFMNPGKYNLLEFSDPEDQSKKTGYFSSASKGRWGTCQNPNSKWFKQPMVDDEGNSNEEAAIDDIMWLRDRARAGLDPKALHSTITQFPLTYKEAFLRNKGTIFSSPELLEWLGEVETTPSIRNSVELGELVVRDGKMEFNPTDKAQYITEFPIRSTADKEYVDSTGCVAIFERPELVNGEVPYSLYIAGCDPYDQDKAGVGSLGSFFIYKRFYSAGKTSNIIVAEYTGRPQFADDFYENCRRLCMYYNAKVLYENMLKGFKAYFERKNCLHYLYEQPGIIRDIVKNSQVQRGYGIHMQRGTNGSSGIKDTCELYLKDWLYTEREGPDGNKIFNFHTIKSIALLKELVAYDGEVNTDRVVALMLCILQTHELHKLHVEQMTGSSSSFANDPFLKRLWEKSQHQGLPKNKFTFNSENKYTEFN